MKRSGGLERALRWMLHFHRYAGVRRWTVTALAAVVVFCAVYNLILPAAAITGRIARETPGIELGTESGSEGLDAVRTNETALGESSGEQPEMTGGGQTDPDGWEEIPEQQGNETDGATAITTEEAAGQSEEAAGTQEGTSGQTGESAGQTEETSGQTEDASGQQDGTSGQTGGTKEPGQTAESTEETTRQEQTGEGTEGQQDPEQDASQEDPAGPEETAEESDETAAQEEAADQEEAEETEDALDEEEIEEEESEEEAEEEETIFEAGSLKARGAGYRVELTYGADARIPQDAKLFADEITEDSPLYEDYIRKTEETLFGETGTASYIRLFDIHIEDPEGEKVQPAEGSSVDVKIELDDKAEDAPVQVVHFAEKEEAGEAETEEEKDPSADQKKAAAEDNKKDTVTAEEPDDAVQPEEIENTESIVLEDVSVEGTSVSFTTDGFSAYAIVEGPEPVPIGWERITSLDELDAYIASGKGLCVGQIGGYYMMNTLTSDSAGRIGITKTKPAASNPPSGAAEYYFEKVAGTTNKYYAYCFDNNGKKQYVYNGGNNSLSFTDAATTAFTVTVNDGKFTLNNGSWYWNMQGGANGTRFCSWSSGNEDNSRFYLWYREEIGTDPYGLDGTSYGLMNWNGGVAGKAMMGSQTGNNLDAKQLTVLSKQTDNGDKLFVPKDSEISMWTFEWDESDRYYLKTTADGSTKYLKISDNGLELVSDRDEAGTIQVVPGTGTHKGEICLKANGATLTYSGALETGFTIGGSAGTEWLYLVEESELTEEYLMPHSAKKVSVSDPAVTNGSKVIVYTRVWNDDMKRYDYYAIGSDGEAVPCYDGGNTIEWVGGVINTMLWDFTDYLDDNGDPTYYYELQNEYSGKYLAPNDADDTILSDDTIGLNMNGRRAGKYQSSILAWDDGSYAYSGLKVENGKIVACPKSEAMDFYFATMEEMPTGDVLHTVPTVDHEKYGITMKITDFETRTEMSNFLGNDEGTADTNLHQGLLSTNLGDDGYPVATRTGGTTLGNLFGQTGQTQVNHLFIKSTYEESGYFEFDSSQNFATLISEGSEGTDFTVYRELGTWDQSNKKSLKHGQFFPYNTIVPGYFAVVNGENLYTATLAPLNNDDPRKNEKLYMIADKDGKPIPKKEPNCQFGVELEASFTQTPSGKDAWGHDIIFEFTGDDDFWLYVDGELTIDLGGIHSAVGGSVNFSTGDVYVNGVHKTLRQVFAENYMARNAQATQADVDAYLAEYFEPGETVFKDFSTHTMRIFYMERGGGASNLHMRFNLASVQPGTVELSKKLDGVDNAESMFAEFPYQIKYKRKGDSTEHLLENGDVKYVFYKDTDLSVPFKSSVTIGGVNYRNVYMLKPGEEAEIRFPTFVTDHGDETIDTYSIVECGVNTSVYEKVSVNGTEVAGTSGSSYQENRKDFGIGFATTDKRARVEYENKVMKDALRSLTFTKKLYSEDGTTEITDDTTPFAFRLYLGTESDPLSLANMHTYHVKDPSGNYCIWDKTQRKLVSLGKSNYDALTKEEKEAASFTTSINGSITNIPAGYQVEVRDLLVDTKYRVEERPGEVPDGYSFMEYEHDNAAQVLPNTVMPNMTDVTGVEGVILDKVGDDPHNPHADICNLKGYGLRINKTWTDEDFMEDRDPTYFAVFTKNGNDLTLVGSSGDEINTVRQLPFGGKTLYWYFCPLPVRGVAFDNYEIREVKLEGHNIQVDENGVVTGYNRVTPVVEEGSGEHGQEELELHGKQIGWNGEGHKFDYTVDYTKGTVEAGSNVRVDEAVNERPGIVIRKQDWDGTEQTLESHTLAGATFTLSEEGHGSSASIGTFTSDENGIVTMIYLHDGGTNLTLTETAAPQGYLGLKDAVTLHQHDGKLIVQGQGLSSEYYYLINNQHGETQELVIKNRPYELKAIKTDSETGDPLAGAKFALHKEVTTGDVTIIDIDPMPGYESLVSGEDGVIPKIDRTLPAGTYELREVSPPVGYQPLPATSHIRFTISPTGVITLVAHPEGVTLTNNKEVLNEPLIYQLTIPNTVVKKPVSIWKTDTGHSTITTGAKFALYRASDYDDEHQKPDPKKQPIKSGTTDENGLLALGVLERGEYRLVETQPPENYDPATGAIKIIVGGTVTALQAGAESEVSVKGDKYWIEGQDEDTWQIRVWNSSGVVLPSTGGRGTRIFTILGALMILGAGVMLFSRRRA